MAMKVKIVWLSVLALVLCGVLSIGAAMVEDDDTAVVVTTGTVLAAADEWVSVCANEKFSLQVNGYNGHFVLTDRQGEQTWSSVPSGAEEDTIASGVYKMELLSNLIVYGTDVVGNKEFKRNSETASVRKNEATVYARDNGFTVVYRFPAEGWTIPLQVALEGDHLAVTVNTAAVTEEKPEEYRIASLHLLPYFGAAGLAEEGYILLPDGSGSLMEFNNGKHLSAEYVTPLYGRDISTSLQVKNTVEQVATLPVFGFSKEKGGLLAVVSGGAELGNIHAQPNRRTSEWASAYCAFDLRPSDVFVLDADSGLPQRISMTYDGELQTAACQVKFYPLGAEEKEYSGMARRMRTYLAEWLGKETKASTPGVTIDLYGAVKKRESFLGLPMERTKVLTSVQEADALLTALQNGGAGGIRMRYLSWSKDILARKVEKSLSPVGGLGTVAELLALQSRLEQQGGKLYLDAELQQFYKGGNGVSDFRDVCRSLSNAPAYQYEFSLSTGLRNNNGDRGLLLSPKKLSSLTTRLWERATEWGFSGLSLGSLSSTLFSDYSDSVLATRSRSLTFVEQAMAERPATLSVLADAPNFYALGWTDEIVGLPAVSSRYDVTDRSVPFVQMVYSGLFDYTLGAVNLGTDTQKALLDALEMGAGLRYTLLTRDNRLVLGTQLNFLTGAQAELWVETILRQQAEVAAVWAQTEGTPIRSHTVLAQGVTRTLYENGTAVYVNRNAMDWQGAGVTVPADGYTVRQEG